MHCNEEPPSLAETKESYERSYEHSCSQKLKKKKKNLKNKI